MVNQVTQLITAILFFLFKNTKVSSIIIGSELIFSGNLLISSKSPLLLNFNTKKIFLKNKYFIF